MQNEDKKVCEDFGTDIFLYIDNDLPVNQEEFYREHLKCCSICRLLLEETEEMLLLSGTAIEEDIEDTKFEFMVSKAVSRMQHGFVKRFFALEKSKKRNAVRLVKIAFNSALVVIALVVTLLIEKPSKVPTEFTNNEIADWNWDEFNVTISELRNELNSDEWNEGEEELLLIDERINQLLKQEVQE